MRQAKGQVAGLRRPPRRQVLRTWTAESAGRVAARRRAACGFAPSLLMIIYSFEYYYKHCSDLKKSLTAKNSGSAPNKKTRLTRVFLFVAVVLTQNQWNLAQLFRFELVKPPSIDSAFTQQNLRAYLVQLLPEPVHKTRIFIQPFL